MKKNSGEFKCIVGIGASAGGLEALQQLLSALPSNTGFPYIIVQHLSPDYKSLLSEILGKYTEMPVVQAENDMEIKADHVYIIQPGKIMTLSNGILHMTDQIPKELNLPIDEFFRSLAAEAKARAVAIVLSGTGSDGTNGIKAVKENEGMVIVQDFTSAKFDGMPRSALRTGIVDAVLTPDKIALELQHIADINIDLARTPSDTEVDADLMKKVYAILKKVCNINFTHYKQTTIIRRMERRMMLTRRENLADYVAYLYDDSEEVRILSKEVLIGVTSFFRDPDFFQTLKDKAISEIVTRSTPENPIRVWVTGCSTGEEAYSIAILFAETLEAMKLTRAVKIFATDLDAESVNTAGKGVYGDHIADSVSTARLSRYFTRRGNTYTVNRDIRKMIVFSPHNVFQDPPFGRLDLISCRNMLIYFQPVLQNDLFAVFHQSLKDNGYLFLGKSEAIGNYTEAFPVLDAAAKIFSHNSDAVISGAKKIPYLQTIYMDDEYVGESGESYISTIRGDVEVPESTAINNSLLEKFLPASIVINDKNEIVHSYGNNANFTHMSVGAYSNNLFDVITDALKIPVSTLLKDSRAKCSEVQYRDIRIKGELTNTVIDLTVLPVNAAASKGENGLFAVIFDDRSKREISADSVEYNVDEVASKRITDLEQELSGIQGKLNHSVAEQECVNEELQAANEELLTANEELQSSNEELQSVNEELYTVNSEYQQKLSELADLNDDIANFLSSTLTGIIFIDNKLNIRRYTDYVTSEFSVMDHDIGRSLAFISYHFPTIDITEICTNVLKTLIPDEREVVTSRNKTFFMRVAPYRSIENKILGCVITLMDITSQKQGQLTLHNTERQLTIAQQASEAKSDYLTRIAHELHAPMSNLISLSEQAMKTADNNPELKEYVKRITDTIDSITYIVTDITEASISERLAGEQIHTPFALRPVLNSVGAVATTRAKNANINFQLDMDKDLDPLYIGNKSKIEQILLNFINHSLKHSNPNDEIVLKALEESRMGGIATLRFVLTDTGVGIKQADIATLFKPFSIGSYADDSNMKAGLDLSIAYNLVMSMNGSVSVDSDIGKGTTYTIRVAVDYDTTDEPAAEPMLGPTDYKLKDKHILVAEDNALNLTILEVTLANEQMTYTDAPDGEAAVKAFVESPEHTFDCILMDMRMPKLDGIRATLEIRASGKADSRTIPIIGVSANGYAEDIKQARLAGIDDYVTKPISREQLLSSMSRLINKK